MKRVYLANDPISANVLKVHLEESGIPAVVQDERTFALRGDLPVVYPSVWVSDENEAKAKTVISEFGHATKSESWMCPVCGETMDAAFSECWKCAQSILKEEPPAIAPSVNKGSFRAILTILFVVLLIISGGLYKAYTYDVFMRHYQAGYAFHQNDKFDDAIREYDLALAVKPSDAGVWLNRGYALFSKQEYARSISDLDKSLELDPTQDGAYETRASAQYALGFFGKSLKDYKVALVGQNHRRDIKLWIAFVKYKIGDLDGALIDLQALRSDQTYGYHAAVFLSWIFSERNELNQAMGELEYAISLEPENPEAYIEKAEVLCDAREYEKALEECDRARRLSSSHSAGEVRIRAAILFRMKRVEESREGMKEFLQISGNDGDILGLRVLAYAILENKTAAEKEIELLLKSRPENRWSYYAAAGATCWLSRTLDADSRTRAQEKSISYLEEAKKHGFTQWQVVTNSVILQDIVNNPRFKKLAGLP